MPTFCPQASLHCQQTACELVHGVLSLNRKMQVSGLLMPSGNVTMTVQVRSVYLATKAVLPSMIKHGGGTIINIVSNSTLVTWSGSSAYATCKSAVIR